MSLHDHLIGNADKAKISSTKFVDRKVDALLNDMEEVPQILVGASQWAIDAWERLGKPNSPFTDSGERLMKVLIAMWEELYPIDAKEWYESRVEYQNAELSSSEQVRKHTGGSLASIPLPIYRMMMKFFPTTKLNGIHGREVCKKLCRRYPMFKMSRVRS